MPPDHKKKNTHAILGSFALGLVAGIGFYRLFVDKGIPQLFLIQKGEEKKLESVISQKDDVHTMMGAKLLAPLPGENVLVVSDQPAGSEVTMSMVSLTVGGWMAVHEKDARGGIGTILGARRLNAGNHFAERIELLRGTREGHMYVAVLHLDNGGEFDYTKDLPLKDRSGALIAEEFLAISNGE